MILRRYYIFSLQDRQDGNVEIIHSTGTDEALIPRYTSATLLKSKSTYAYYAGVHAPTSSVVDVKQRII